LDKKQFAVGPNAQVSALHHGRNTPFVILSARIDARSSAPGRAIHHYLNGAEFPGD
jgi:hypothetical protein